MADPGFSLIIPAHNEQDYLGATLRAARHAAIATDRPFEIIVVDDDSTDATARIAEQAGVRVIPVALRNIGAVRNAGARSARFDRLVFLDADTILPVETLRNTMAAMDDGIAGGAWVEMPMDSGIPWASRALFKTVRFLWQRVGRWAAGCYLFCDRRTFESFGGFPEAYYAAEEFFVSRQLKRLGRFTILQTPVVSSPRKLYDYSTWQLLKFMLAPFLWFRGGLKSRAGLDLLYRHREGNENPERDP